MEIGKMENINKYLVESIAAALYAALHLVLAPIGFGPYNSEF